MLTREEAELILTLLEGVLWLVCSLLYGAGLRLFEAFELRVKDINFTRSELLLHDGKGQKDQVAMLPVRVQVPLCGRRSRGERMGARVTRGIAEWKPLD